MGLGLDGWDFTGAGTGLFEALLSVLDSGTAGEKVPGEAAERRRENNVHKLSKKID